MLVEPATGADYEAVRALDRTLMGVRDRAEALREWINRGECLVARDDHGNVSGFAVANSSFFAQSFIVLLVVQRRLARARSARGSFGRRRRSRLRRSRRSG